MQLRRKNFSLKQNNLGLAALLILLSVLAILVNLLSTKYPGNNYFPPETPIIGLMLVLLYTGSRLQFGSTSPWTATIREVIYFSLVLVTIIFATNAVQFTPFTPIDKKIIEFEYSLGIYLDVIMQWTAEKPWLKFLLSLSYDSLSLQITLVPLIFIFIRRYADVHEYYFLVLISCLLGFLLYYFFPTTAPASVISSPHFMEVQRITGNKFLQIHQHITPTSIAGGMIALPSFHVIWGWLCLYLARGLPGLFIVLLPVNILLVMACVLLGWHYTLDIAGSVIILMITHGLYFFMRDKHVSYKYVSTLKRSPY